MIGGQLRCIGTPLDLTARLGGFHLVTLSTPAAQAPAARNLLLSLCPEARLVYELGGTQRFEVQCGPAALKKVFAGIEGARRTGALEVTDFQVSRATLEDVFLKMCEQYGSTDLNV